MERMALTNQESDAVNGALSAFAASPVKEIPDELENLLESIAKTGRATYPWEKVKLLLVQKLDNVIEQYLKDNPDESVPLLPNVENVPFGDMKQRLLTNINKFRDAPFTIQRICELLMFPKKYYKQRDKFMRGIEKNILIVTTVTPAGKRITSVSNGPPMVNGILPSDNIPNGTQPKETQFKVPSSPGEARHQPSSSGESSSHTALSHQEPSGEPSPKRIKLQDLPDHSIESPSTSDDRIPSSDMSVQSNDGVSSIDDSQLNRASDPITETVSTEGVSSNEAASVNNSGDRNDGADSEGGTDSEGQHIPSDNDVTSNNDITSDNGVSSDGDSISKVDVTLSSNDDISDQNGVSSNNDIADHGTTAQQISPDAPDGPEVSPISGEGESTDLGESPQVGQSIDISVGDSSAEAESGPVPSDSECPSGNESISSEAMDTSETLHRPVDQAELSPMHTGVESSSEVNRGHTEAEPVHSGADEEMNSGTDEVRGSEEEMEVQSSTQVTVMPAVEEETNEAVAAKQNREGGE